MIRFALLMSVLCVAGCAPDPGDGLYQARVPDFTGASVEVGLVRDCAAFTSLGFADAVLSSATYAKPVDLVPLGMLEPGTYGLAARAINGPCRVVSLGCQAIQVEATETGEVIFDVVFSTDGDREELCPLEECTSGLCEDPEDAGPRPPDAGPDSP